MTFYRANHTLGERKQSDFQVLWILVLIDPDSERSQEILWLCSLSKGLGGQGLTESQLMSGLQ